jgi:hypothetical protein
MTATLALDRPLTFTATRWSRDLVQLRLVEAFEIDARIPDSRGPRRSSASAWPTMYREFEDMVGWSDEARAEWWTAAARAKGVFSYEVTRMEEALAWLAWLAEHPGEQRCLHAWAFTRARRRSLMKLCRTAGWDKQTFYRRLNTGAIRIAERLNKNAVAVR